MLKSTPRLLTVMIALSLTTACDGVDDLREMLNSSIMYVPSSSMEPTLPIGSRFNATLIEPSELRRGELYIVQRQMNDARVLRLLGTPGDTIALNGGSVILNGENLRQEAAGKHSYETQYEGTQSARMYREFLPGKDQGYGILDSGASELDDRPAITLGPDQYFLLGDNRDNAADSRMEPGEFGAAGVGIVAADDITHRVDMASLVVE